MIVADPNFAPMYATRSRRTKSDRRDARTLMDACRLGAYRYAHRASDDRRHVRAELAVRDALVRTRTRISLSSRIAEMEASAQLRAELQPLLDLLPALNAQINAADERIAKLDRTDTAVALLMTAPGIGAITASAVVATIDDITRVPVRTSSKPNSVWCRVSSAPARNGVSVRLPKPADTTALRAWALKISARRGRHITAVALARRLAGILYAMWRDQQPCGEARDANGDPLKNAEPD